MIHRIKWFIQKIFRKNHTSDIELFNLCDHMAIYIHRKLKAYSEMEQSGYPTEFTLFEDSHLSKESYNFQIATGGYIGGGVEAWEKVLSEMVFAFEYGMYSNNFDKEQDTFYERWNLKDPYKAWSDALGTKKSQDSKIDYNTVKKHSERAQKGMEYFAKYFWNLWD